MSLSVDIELLRAARDAETLGRHEAAALLLEQIAPQFEFRKPPKMALELTSFDSMLKQHYSADAIANIAMTPSPLLGMPTRATLGKRRY